MNVAIPILMYHSIAEDAPPAFRKWAVQGTVFADHLAYLYEQGYTPLTVSRLVQIRSETPGDLPKRPVIITFDDGLLDFYTDALPILQAYQCVATLYITTGYVGGASRWLEREGAGNRPMLNWPQIQEIQASGIECGAHSHTHPQLDTLPLPAARCEIVQSKTVLEQHLGQPVSTFAYPHGYYSSRVRQLVQEAGFSSACAVKHGLSHSSDDRFALGRIIVTRDTDVETLGRYLRGENLRLAPSRERLQTTGWRFVRRSQKVLQQHVYQRGRA